MAAPYPLLIKKKKNDGTETSVINTETAYGMVVSSIPFHFSVGTKEPYSNDWLDENGSEVHLPDDGLPIESYDMDVSFIYRGAFNSLAANLRSFIDYLRGSDGNGSRLTIYDAYNGVGRKDVYLKNVSPDTYVKQNIANAAGEEIATFKVTLRVCDPITNITLSE